MDENVELLEYVYKNSEMGSFTINKLLKELEEKDNKIKKLAKEEFIDVEKLNIEKRVGQKSPDSKPPPQV